MIARALLIATLSAAPAAAASPFLDVNNSLSASFLRSHLDFRQPGNVNGGNDLGVESGYTGGSRLALSIMRCWEFRNMYFRADWQGTSGKTDFAGYFTGTSTPVPGFKTRSTIQEANFRLGKGFEAGKSWMLTPFFGWGWRHWVREVALGTPADADLSYNNWYWAFGGMFQFAPAEDVLLTADGALGRTEDPFVTHSNPAVGFDHKALGVSMIQRYGGEADYRVYKALHMFAGLNYEFFTFGASSASRTGFVEPFSKTRVWEWTVGARLSFSPWILARD